MPLWQPAPTGTGPSYTGGPSWHQKWAPEGGYYGPSDGEPYPGWRHTWHLHPGLESQGQFRTTAPVTESALLARPWEVPELRYIAEQNPGGWRSTLEGVSELTREPWQFEVDGAGRMKCLVCCASMTGSCGAPGHGRRRPVQAVEQRYPSLPPPGAYVPPEPKAPPPLADGHWETRTERVWVPRGGGAPQQQPQQQQWQGQQQQWQGQPQRQQRQGPNSGMERRSANEAEILAQQGYRQTQHGGDSFSQRQQPWASSAGQLY